MALPYFSYIIVSVQPKGTAHVRSWQLNEQRHFAEEAIVALPDAWPMPGFLQWAVGHVEVLEARPVKLSMEDVFVQTVASASS